MIPFHGSPAGNGAVPPPVASPSDPYAAPGEPNSLPRPPRVVAPPPAPPAVPRIAAHSEKLRSGVRRWRGEGTDPLVLIRSIARLSAPHLIVNRVRFQQPLPQKCRESCLWTWYPEEIAIQVSPRLISPALEPLTISVVPAAWGKDCLVVLFARQEPEILTSHLRRVIRGDEGSPAEPPSRILGFHFPTAARALFTHGTARLLDPLLSGLDAFLMEAERPGAWELYCSAEFAEKLRAVFARA